VKPASSGPVIASVVFGLLAIVHTWPLATAPHVLSQNDHGDALLNEWIVAWVQHQLPRDPARLFDANIFHPARGTLAMSEPLIVPAILGAPVRLLGGSPVLVYNLLLVAGLVLSALAMYALIHDWTGDRAAALVAGSAFAFNTHTLTRLAHLQAVHVYGLPLALLAADRILTRARVRDAMWLAAWMTAMAYTSGYLVVLSLVLIGATVLVRAGDVRERAPAVLSRLALAAAATAAAVLPLYLQYRRAAIDHGLGRTLDNVAQFSATLPGYLVTTGWLHGSTWSHRLFRDPIDAFFPGISIALLAIAAFVSAWRGGSSGGGGSTRRRVLALLAVAAVGVVLSLGTGTPIYGWLYGVFPPMRGIRAAARFGGLFLFAMAALAGIGLAMIRGSRGAGVSGRVAIAAAIVAAVNLEALSAPFKYTSFEGIPGVYRLLAGEPGPVVLVEQPFYRPEVVFMNAEYVFNSTAHWRPLMNGYSGYTPRAYREHAVRFSSFPDERAVRAMRDAGVTHVIVHPSRYGREAPEIMRQVSAVGSMERMAVGRAGITLYRLR
jgi:hypothetical protein